MTERWLPVVGHPGYEINDHGRVRGPKGLRPVYLKLPRRVPRVEIGKVRYVHHLVLEAFVGPRPIGMECCHLDDDPTNNYLSNLRWDTRSANSFDAVRNGRHPTGSKTRCTHGHDLTPDNVWVARSGRRHCRACWKARKQEKKTVNT